MEQSSKELFSYPGNRPPLMELEGSLPRSQELPVAVVAYSD
jgi:hypothetical protein